jgi:hypothetical protein
MASVSALGARCMYLSVIVSVLWPTNSWIALGAAPLVARCEQNVCLSTCEPMVRSPPIKTVQRVWWSANVGELLVAGAVVQGMQMGRAVSKALWVVVAALVGLSPNRRGRRDLPP